MSDPADWVETVEALKHCVYLFFRNEALEDWSVHDCGVPQQGAIAVWGMETIEMRGAIGAVRYVRRFAEHRTAGSQFSGRCLCLVLAAANDDRRASILEDNLGDRFTYPASSSDDDQFLSTKFEFHRVRPFGLLEATRSTPAGCS